VDCEVDPAILSAPSVNADENHDFFLGWVELRHRKPVDTEDGDRHIGH
jgi:hypothetical protein